MGNYPSGKLYRNLGFYLLFLIIMISMITSLIPSEAPPQVFTYTQFLDAVQRGLVEKVVIVNHDLSGEMKDGTKFTTYAPDDPNLIATLRNKNVDIEAQPPPEPSWWVRILG
ncbi:MAG TPA: ATP-dependent metallopeptidase FtsH/Yme1/Tma family protein, partial [Candidatus Atribacteria bacterium]|nr:ATP-dependent metallopeptidase FtsH/Yme1/Tma family protein [Candidatus Atribacteria bacterium]